MPKVSVIMPVYNGEEFLREAIDSILAQSFSDFEFIIVNDGSTDTSESIIRSYNDPQIVYIENEKNEGVIFSLNKAIDAAQGEFIARMDADDIAIPERLEKQVEYLITHPDVSIVASTVQLIDEKGHQLKDWQEDINHISSTAIKRYLPINNCIAHPSIMGRAELFRKYKYQRNQKFSEDYDLWLRLLSDKKKIEKIGEPLLYHRILQTSVTRSKKVNVFYRIGKVKFRFFSKQITKGRLNLFVLDIFLHGLVDFIKGTGKEIKRRTRKHEIQTAVS